MTESAIAAAMRAVPMFACDRGEYLDQLIAVVVERVAACEAVVHGLAAHGYPVDRVGATGVCALCRTPKPHELTHHATDCVWRQAVELVRTTTR